MSDEGVGVFWVREPGRVLDVRREVRDGVEYVVKVLDDDTHRPGSQDEHRQWWQKTWSAPIAAGEGSELGRKKAEAKRKADAEYEASRWATCENCQARFRRDKGEKSAAPKVCTPCRVIYAEERRPGGNKGHWDTCAACKRPNITNRVKDFPGGPQPLCRGCVQKFRRGTLNYAEPTPPSDPE